MVTPKLQALINSISSLTPEELAEIEYLEQPANKQIIFDKVRAAIARKPEILQEPELLLKTMRAAARELLEKIN